MSNIQISNLPAAVFINGSEELEAVQAGTSVRVTAAQISGLTPGPTGPAGTPGAPGLSITGPTGPTGPTGSGGAPGSIYTTTSNSTLTIGSGTKNLVIGINISYTVAQEILIAYDSTHYMICSIVSYNAGSGALVVNVDSYVGSGTYSLWTCLLYTSPSPRDGLLSRMPSSA